MFAGCGGSVGMFGVGEVAGGSFNVLNSSSAARTAGEISHDEVRGRRRSGSVAAIA